MSIVIAIKDKNRIVMGCDQQVSGSNLKFNASDNNSKIWDVNNIKGAIMSCVGDARMVQLVSLMDFVLSPTTILNKKINYKSVAGEMFNIIYNHLLANKNIEYDSNNNPIQKIGGYFIFAYKNQAYLIYPNEYTIPIEDYLAMGSGEEVAVGALEETKGLPAEERIRKAIEACSARTLYVSGNVIIKSTKK